MPITPHDLEAAYVKSVDRFGRAMLDQLFANAHKGHWADCEIAYLMDRLREEVYELEAALLSGQPNSVRREAADVGNFAMMIAELRGRR